MKAAVGIPRSNAKQGMARNLNRVIGAAKLRKKLDRMPVVIRSGITAAIATEAQLVKRAIQDATPVDADSDLKAFDGRAREHLRDAVNISITKKGLRARIGYIKKRTRMVYWFARLLEYGFHPRGGWKLVKKPFFYQAWASQRGAARGHVISATKRAIEKASKL